jgi:hypothetical protein
VSFPYISAELAHRLENCDTNFIRLRLEYLARLEGNPFGAEVRPFGNATGLTISSMAGNTLFNRVAEFTPAELDRLDDILAWFEEKKIGGRFDLLPGHVSPELFNTLAAKGFYQSGFYAGLYGEPQVSEPEFSGVSVREAQPDELSVYGDIYMAGFGFPAERREALVSSMTGLYGHPAVRLYLGLVDGTPAGIGFLLLNKGVGYMGTATTLAQFRGRGVQKALMYRRMADAAQNGCDLVTSHTQYASLSQTNMEKVGLRLGYTKAIWTRSP